MNRAVLIIVVTILILSGCTPSEDSIQTAIAQTQATNPTKTPISSNETPTLSETIASTPPATTTLTQGSTNTPQLPTKSECMPSDWPNLATNIEKYVGKCIYLEGRVIAINLLDQPDDQGRLTIRPPEPNNGNLYLEAIVHGDKGFYKTLNSLIINEQGWIAIWGILLDERNSTNNPSPVAGYPLDGYMLFASSAGAMPACPVNQARDNEGVCH